MLKEFLNVGGRVVLTVNGRNIKSKSGKLIFLAGVNVEVQFLGERMMFIRGSLKQFVSNGNVQLDLSNSTDADFENSGIGKELAELINTGSVAGIRDKIGENGIACLDIGVDSEGNFTYSKHARMTRQIEVSEVAKSLIDAADSIKEEKAAKVATTQIPLSAEQMTMLANMLKQSS